jgi:thymidylate kinase
MIIAICGMDGTGKTTLAQTLTDDLCSQGKRASMFHGHEYAVSSTSFGLTRNTLIRYRWFFKFLLPMAYADNLYTYYSRYLPKSQGRILVLDRYFYDKLARMISFGICGQILARIYARLIPKPDKLFFLDLPGEIARKRNQEYTVEQFEKFRRAYLFIAEELGYEPIPTTRSFDECRSRIWEAIISNE